MRTPTKVGNRGMPSGVSSCAVNGCACGKGYLEFIRDNGADGRRRIALPVAQAATDTKLAVC